MQCSVLNSARLSVQSPAADSVTTERVGLLCRGPQLQHSDYTLATQLLSLQNLIFYQAIAAAEKTSPKSTVALGLLWKKWQTSCPKSYCHSLCSQLSAVSLWLSPKWHSISYGNWSNLVQFLLHIAVILLSPYCMLVKTEEASSLLEKPILEIVVKCALLYLPHHIFLFLRMTRPW